MNQFLRSAQGDYLENIVDSSNYDYYKERLLKALSDNEIDFEDPAIEDAAGFSCAVAREKARNWEEWKEKVDANNAELKKKVDALGPTVDEIKRLTAEYKAKHPRK